MSLMRRVRTTKDPAANDRERAAGLARAKERSRFGEWVWYGLLSLLLALVIVGAVSAASAVSPSFCATCHEDEAQALAESTHSEVSCDSCHRREGAAGLVENRFWVAGMVIESPVRAFFPSGGKANVATASCLSCHASHMPATAVRNGVRMNHEAPVGDGWPCQRCHRNVGHAARSLASYTMGTCLGCHSTGPHNLSSCDTCHPVGERPSAVRAVPATWEITHGANWRQTHGMGDLATCGACHSRTYCVSCHDIALPHPPNYLSVHGDDVIKLGENTCTGCHDAASCDACHGGVEMPHPPGLLKSHSSEVESFGREVCERCHASASCEGCHARHTHPGIPRERLQGLKERPVRGE